MRLSLRTYIVEICVFHFDCCKLEEAVHECTVCLENPSLNISMLLKCNYVAMVSLLCDVSLELR